MTTKNKQSSPSRARTTGRKGRRVSPWAWIGLAVPLAALVAIIIVGSVASEPGSDLEAQQAPVFTLPDTAGGSQSLDQILARGDALLYFSMGVGCDGCFDQIPEAAAGLQARGIQLVPVMVDGPQRVAHEAARFGITTPILIDESREVSDAYGMLGIYGHGDRPNHSFALVRADGTVAWVKHYATMFVPFDQLLADMGRA